MSLSIGGQDGYGRYGILDADSDGALLCHKCGEYFQHLATHARMTHGLYAAEYRSQHGLGRSARLVGEQARQAMRQGYERRKDEALADLAKHRDPDKARAKSVGAIRGEGWRPAVVAKRTQMNQARAGRDLTTDEVSHLGDPVHVRAWTGAAIWLIDERGVTIRAIAEASEMRPGTAEQRIRRGRKEQWPTLGM